MIWGNGSDGLGTGGPDGPAVSGERDACKYQGQKIAWTGPDSTGTGTGGPEGATPPTTDPVVSQTQPWYFNLKKCTDGSATDLWIAFFKSDDGRARAGGPDDNLLEVEAVIVAGVVYQVLNFYPKPKQTLDITETLVTADVIYTELDAGYSGCGKVELAPASCPWADASERDAAGFATLTLSIPAHADMAMYGDLATACEWETNLVPPNGQAEITLAAGVWSLDLVLSGGLDQGVYKKPTGGGPVGSYILSATISGSPPAAVIVTAP